ncbi:unnamed protein product [Scytosiphon promiscuus]
MAKSIRSKVKKRNRTEMRKNVGDPHQRKLQARCTAKIQKSVAFSAGESVTKLKSMLTAAQVANPPTKEVSKNGFSFRHPDAPPPLDDDDDEATAAAAAASQSRQRTRGRATRGRARSLSDAEASMVDEDTAMGDVGDDDAADEDGNDDGGASGGGPAGARGGGGGVGGAKGAKGGRNTASELAAKVKKKRRQAKRRNYVEFPAPENN